MSKQNFETALNSDVKCEDQSNTDELKIFKLIFDKCERARF